MKLDQIRELILSANTGTSSDYIYLLDRVIQQAEAMRKAAILANFGEQFKQTEVALWPDDTTSTLHQFHTDQKVRTKDGYIGTVAGYDTKGRVVVNVVWQACEYPEAHLTAIPDKSVLDSMRAT